MKISCLQENLNRGLSIVGRAVATRTTLPITNNVMLTTENGQLKLSATNLEIAITTWVGADIEEEGSITVPARLLTEFVGSLPPDKTNLTILENRQLELTCARQKGRISGSESDNFPPIPSIGDGTTVEIDPDELRSAIQRVVFAAATDEARPVLTGVHTSIEDNTLTLAAADGFRLAVNNLNLSNSVTEKIEAIVPARSYNELVRLLGDQKEPVQITFNPDRSQVLFQLNNAEMVSQLIQGQFPNFNQLIPETTDSKATIDTNNFLQAMRTASIFARDGNGIVRLSIESGEDQAPGKLSLTARSEEVGENTGEIDAQIEGSSTQIAFNSRYLTDVLNVIGTGQVVLETTNPSSPGVVRPLGSDTYIHVVMPMFVQW
jgi:DNA polymerase-3 subunit beta